MNSYCTIVDENYLPYAYALYDSIYNISNDEFEFYVFVSNRHSSVNLTSSVKKGINYIYIDEICNQGIAKEIYQNYFTKKVNAFRWSMKPVLINYIFDKFNPQKIFCIDCDVRFFSNNKFLFDLLDENHVLLSPHFRSSDPINNYDNFILQYNSGIFNGGFVGASYLGKDAMNWWANACLSICEFNPVKGQYYDQVHLNLLPVYFDNVHIIRHRGCNVANWNLVECKRTLSNNNVLIDDKYPIVFIHFTKSTMLGILRGEDKYLFKYFEEYSLNVKEYNPNIDLMLVHCNLLKEEDLLKQKRLTDQKNKPSLYDRIRLKIKSLMDKNEI